jgi:hypothetical protein
LGWGEVLGVSLSLVLGIPKSVLGLGWDFLPWNALEWTGSRLGGWVVGLFFHFGLKFVVLLCALFYEIMTGKGGFLYIFIIYIFEFDSSL